MKKVVKKSANAMRIKRPKPQEFLEIMGRLKLIDQEIKKETELYEIKVKSLELEKQYLWNKVNPENK